MNKDKLNVTGIVQPEGPGSKRLMGHPELVISVRDYTTHQFKAYGKNSIFFRALAEQKKILATKCKIHGVFLPPRPFCPECQSPEMEWVDYTEQPAHIKTSSICAFAGASFLDEIPFALGFIQMGESNTVMSTVVKLSEDPEENKRMLTVLMNTGRYLELNGRKVEPRFVENPTHTVRDLYFFVAEEGWLKTLI